MDNFELKAVSPVEVEAQLEIKDVPDIYAYPAEIASPNSFPENSSVPENRSVTVGDMHASISKCLYFLVSEGILQISEDDYHELQDIASELQFRIPENEGRGSLNVTLARQQELFQSFSDILDRATVSKRRFVRFLGDDMADRNGHDYLMLLVYRRLHRGGAPFEVMLSNHSFEFIRLCEHLKAGGTLDKFKSLFKPSGRYKFKNSDEYQIMNHGNSLYALIASLKSGAVTQEEILALYDEVYAPHLSLISAESSDESIQVYTHAPIDPATVGAAADVLGIDKGAYDLETITGMQACVTEVNRKFREERVNKHCVVSQCNPGVLEDGYEVIAPSIQHPVERMMWLRAFNFLEVDVLKKWIQKNPKSRFVHGHTSTTQYYDSDKGQLQPVENQDQYFSNLDNDTWKMPRSERKKAAAESGNQYNKAESGQLVTQVHSGFKHCSVAYTSEGQYGLQSARMDDVDELKVYDREVQTHKTVEEFEQKEEVDNQEVTMEIEVQSGSPPLNDIENPNVASFNGTTKPTPSQQVKVTTQPLPTMTVDTDKTDRSLREDQTSRQYTPTSSNPLITAEQMELLNKAAVKLAKYNLDTYYWVHFHPGKTLVTAASSLMALASFMVAGFLGFNTALYFGVLFAAVSFVGVCVCAYSKYQSNQIRARIERGDDSVKLYDVKAPAVNAVNWSESLDLTATVPQVLPAEKENESLNETANEDSADAVLKEAGLGKYSNR